MNKAFSALFLAILLTTSPQALGWSSSGHKIIAEIAAEKISSDTRSKIKALLGDVDLQKAAWWPDTIKSTAAWKHTKGYHFKDINDGIDYFTSLKNGSDYQKQKGDMLRALIKAEDMLRSPSESQTNKVNALRFLLHLTGDIHQPLHSGYVSDVGGNTVKLDWFGSSRSLHSLWDGGIISSYAYKNSLPKETQIVSYVQDLRVPSAKELEQWEDSYIYDWFQESLSVRSQLYVGLDKPSEDYYNSHVDLNNERLLHAGYRLAHWLDQIFSNAPLSNRAKKLRSDIQAALAGSGTVGEIRLTPAVTNSLARAPFESPLEEDDCDHHH